LKFAKQVISLTRKTQRQEADIKQLQQELKEVRQEVNQLRQEFSGVSRLLERLVLEIQHDREKAELERKNLLLEIEYRRLKTERLQLPREIESPPED